MHIKRYTQLHRNNTLCLKGFISKDLLKFVSSIAINKILRFRVWNFSETLLILSPFGNSENYLKLALTFLELFCFKRVWYYTIVVFKISSLSTKQLNRLTCVCYILSSPVITIHFWYRWSPCNVSWHHVSQYFHDDKRKWMQLPHNSVHFQIA